MEGYQVLTADEETVGEVVGQVGDTLLVRHGTLRKTTHALPLAFAEVDEGTRTVRTTLSKQLVHDSPAVDPDDLDERAVARYYGLASGFDAPPAEGYGVSNADDPAWGAEQDELRAGQTPAAAQRAAIRENLGGGRYGPPGRPIIPPDAHEVGGQPTE